ncbi:hypothetical protein GobsT_71530 [Gemmata obscuriglobus]|uniref:Uncharacterized protein n=1 Tax=Gemmata obscuriglobus TaxID=114 RepID=A0A2Z3H4P4_9BACT|nr:hypothetical protein [Gemmata obscuriglobus]AWM41749.1 hypothetical protein C1280_35295 [Gemmata obscuriglobus]QEG32300.1 hypothetical protein GobsT_71530 [Gemmata obscuriglobus]VTS11656.1 unnamed protein product [Gemmata obscuriglobus UQM 2246]
MSDPILISCPKCGSSSGDVCRTKGGKHKRTCAERVPAGATPPPVSKSVGQFVPDLLAGIDDPPPGRASAPAPVTAPPPKPADDFDENTPPPRGRPQGEPLRKFVELPPGEPVLSLFEQWDKDGKFPAGCVLAEHVRDGYRLTAGTLAEARIGRLIPDKVLEPLHIWSSVHLRPGKFPEVPRSFVVFSLVRRI